VNPDIDAYTKNPNRRKILQKRQKNNDLLKTKIILKPNDKLSGGPVFTFSLPKMAVRTPPPVSYATGCEPDTRSSSNQIDPQPVGYPLEARATPSSVLRSQH